MSKHIKDYQQAKSAEEKRSLETGKKVVGYVLHCKFTSNNTILTLTSQYVRVGKNAEKLSDEQKMIDLVRPLEDVKINLTAGVLGFRNTKQGEYEAGFQTAARMFALIEERGYLKQGGSRSYLHSGNSNRSHNNSGSRLGLELIFSNFGKGREAFLNALNGVEGNNIRPFVNRVTDNTKIKIGGVRPPRARRV